MFQPLPQPNANTITIIELAMDHLMFPSDVSEGREKRRWGERETGGTEEPENVNEETLDLELTEEEKLVMKLLA